MSLASLQDVGFGSVLVRAVERRARREGQTAVAYVRSLIERDLLADKTFDEMLKPFRADIRRSGITVDELDRIVERARAARPRSRRTRR